MFAIIFILIQYDKSRYGRDPTKEIVVDHVDTFEILDNNIERPKNVTVCNSKDWVNYSIDTYDYPYPTHEGSKNSNIKAKIINEGKKINNFYKSRGNFKQEELCYHPAAFEQDFSSYETLSVYKAVKVRVTLNPYVGDVRVSNLYLPPGELATFELFSDEAVGKVSITVNNHKENNDDAYKYNRYPRQQCGITLKNRVTTWGYPFGGPITFQYSGSFAIELNVTGCLRAPLYQYGVTDEAQYDALARSSKVPSRAMDLGSIVALFPYERVVGDPSRIDDVAEFYRSVKTRSQMAVPDQHNPRYDRPTQPAKFWFDDFTYGTFAVTIPGDNRCMNPVKSAKYMFDFEGVVNGREFPAWVIMHENNHLHQTNYGYPGTLEESNNVMTAMEWVYQSKVTTTKKVENGKMYLPNYNTYATWNQFIWALVESKNMKNGETEWAVLLHSFGAKKFNDYLVCSSENKRYPSGKYSEVGRHILCSMWAYKVDILKLCQNNPTLEDSRMGNKKDAFYAEYNKSPYKGKNFHPMANYYTNGFERDGERFTTQERFAVDPGSVTTFDFNAALRFQGRTNTSFGFFEFHSMKGTEGRWKEKRKGVYDYTATYTLKKIEEEFTVDYIDISTNEITRTYGQLKLSRSWMMNFTYEKYKYTKKNGLNMSKNAVENYKVAVNLKPDKNGSTQWYCVDVAPKQNFLSVVHGYFVPTVTGKINLAYTSSSATAVYFSDKPLKGNPTDDKEFLILDTDYRITAVGEWGGSKPLSIVKGHKYYLNFIYLVRYDTEFGMDLRMKNAAESWIKWRGIDNNWYRLPDTTNEMAGLIEWKPEFIRMNGLNVWRGSDMIREDSSSWKLVKYPAGRLYTNNQKGEGSECKDCDINNILLKGDYKTEFRANWWSGTGYTKFPHEFIIDFNESTSFSFIKLTGAGNQNYFRMNSSIEIRVADTKSDLYSNSTYVFKKRYISTISNFIQLGKTVEGQFLSIKVLDNSFKWKDGNDGRTDISGIDVGTKRIYIKRMDIPKGCNWTVKKDFGYGINGRYFIGKAGNSSSFTVPKSSYQFGFIGALYDGMGIASVYCDGVKVGTIDKNLITSEDRYKMKFASKSYMSILYMSDVLTKDSVYTITVDSGEIMLTGIITGEEPDDDDNQDSDSKRGSGGSTGAIVGAVIGVIIVVIIAVMAFFIIKKRLSNKDQSSEGGFTV